MQSALDMFMSMRYTNLRFIIIIIVIKTENDWREGHLQVAMHR